MNVLALRILLFILVLFGISACLMARVNSAALLNLPSVYVELESEETSVDRRQELVLGLENVLVMRQRVNESLWWIGLGVASIACLAITLRPNSD